MGEDAAQATVEAAVLLPSFLIVLLLALQPVCLLYTRSVMEGAAAETARLMVTGEGATEEGGAAASEGGAQADAYRAFALRRLAAVPDLSIFHAGGPLSWDIAFSGAAATGGEVRVAITGAVSPLPVLGAFVGLWGPRNAQGDVELSVEVAYAGRPSWLEGSYETWTATWD